MHVRIADAKTGLAVEIIREGDQVVLKMEPFGSLTIPINFFFMVVKGMKRAESELLRG